MLARPVPALRSVRLAIAVVVAAIALAGCGGDDESSSKSDTSTIAATTSVPTTQTGKSETTMAPDGTPTTRTAPPSANGAATSPEDQPGGAGDEVPNSTQALITGKGGKLVPPTVSVPPFIAVTLELRSGDGKSYALSGGGKSVRASGSKPGTASFDGLRSGEKITLTGPQGKVTITANAEPGP